MALQEGPVGADETLTPVVLRVSSRGHVTWGGLQAHCLGGTKNHSSEQYITVWNVTTELYRLFSPTQATGNAEKYIP